MEDDKIFENIVREKSKFRIVTSNEEANDEWEKYSSFDSIFFIEENKEKMYDYHLIGDEKSLSIDAERIASEDIVGNCWYLCYLFKDNTLERYSVGAHVF